VLEAPAVADGSISNLTIVGTATAAGAAPDTSCSPADQGEVRVQAGILAGSASGGISIQDLRIRHVHGNAINLGELIQWVPASPPSCLGDWCLARRLMFNGQPKAPNQVRWNHICDARFGGVVVVGKHLSIRENTISVSWQPWTSGSFGTTMGVSAGFVGTTDVAVEGNTISGADYGVGSDGSVPLHLTVELFKRHWSEIVSALGSSFQQAYPGGVPLDSQGELAFKQGTDDFVKAQQVLLDLAARQYAGTSEHLTGFVRELRISNNTISDTVTGVAVYRGRRVWVGGNRLTRNPGAGLNKVGVHIDESHDCYVYDNQIRGWGTGVLLSGRPGGRTRWGASFNGVGVYLEDGSYPELGNTLTENARGIVFDSAGHDNAVRRNIVAGSTPACDFSGALPNTSGNDWTTDNTPAQCNADY